MSTLEAPRRAYPTRGAAALAPARRPAPTPIPAPETRPRHLRVVAPAERVRRRLTPATGVVLTAIVFVLMFLIAIAHTVLVQGQVRLDALDTQLSVEQARYQVLRKEVAEMESPTRIVAAAESMGMVSPDDLVYLQPSTPDPTVTASEAGADAEGTGDERGGGGTTWSVMKPLLGTHAP